MCIIYIINLSIFECSKKEVKEVRASEQESIQSRVWGKCDKEKEIILWDNKKYEDKYRNCNVLG